MNVMSLVVVWRLGGMGGGMNCWGVVLIFGIGCMCGNGLCEDDVNGGGFIVGGGVWGGVCFGFEFKLDFFNDLLLFVVCLFFEVGLFLVLDFNLLKMLLLVLIEWFFGEEGVVFLWDEDCVMLLCDVGVVWLLCFEVGVLLEFKGIIVGDWYFNVLYILFVE